MREKQEKQEKQGRREGREGTPVYDVDVFILYTLTII